jgi:hypothetical protein
VNLLITYILYFIALYVSLYFFGYPFRVLYNEQLKRNDLFVTPWLGLAFVSIISIYLNLVGLHISQFAYFFILFMFILNFYIYFKYRPSFSFNKKQIIFVTIALITSCLYLMFPLYANGLGMSVNLLGNNDFVSYLYAIDHLTNASMIDLKKADGFPSYLQIYSQFFEQSRLSVIPISYFSYVFDLKPYQFTFLFTSFILFLNAITFSLFFPKRMFIQLVVFFMVILNSNYQWLLYFGFIGHIFSIGLLLVIMYLFKIIVEDNRFDFRLLVLVSLIFVFYGQNYPESVPYALLPIFLYFLFILRNKEKVIIYLKNIVFISIFILIFDYRIYINVINLFIQLSGQKAGWDMPIASLPHMLGLINNNFMSNGTLTFAIVIILNILLIFFILLYLKMKRFNSFHAAIIYSYTITYIIFIYKYDLYKIYKANISFSYIFIIATVSSLWYLSLKGKYYKYITYGILSFLLLMSLYSSSKFYLNAIYKQIDSGTITEEHEILRSIVNANKNTTNYYIDVENWWDEMVAEYFSPKGNTFVTSGVGYSGMKSTKVPAVNDIYITDSMIPENIKMNMDYIYSNQVYQIYKVSEKTIYNYEKIGLGILQKNYLSLNKLFVDTTRPFLDNEVSLKFDSKLLQKAKLDVVLIKSNDISSDITIFFNGREINRSTLKNSIEISLSDLEFNVGSNELIIQTNDKLGISLGDITINDARFAPVIPPTKFKDIKSTYQKIMKLFVHTSTNGKLSLNDQRALLDVKYIDINSRYKYQINVTNLGKKVWESTSEYPVNLGVHLFNSEKKLLNQDFARITLGNSKLQPSKSIEFNYNIDVSTLEKGEYYIQFQMVQETVAWFPERTGNQSVLLKFVVN